MQLDSSNALIETISNIENDLHVRAIPLDIHPKYLRTEARCYIFKESENWRNVDDETFLAIRDSLEKAGWHLSRQISPKLNNAEHHYIVPLEHIYIETLFHTTRTKVLRSIQSTGLLTANRERCNFERIDSIGNLYGVLELGNPCDKETNQFGTAYWWRDTFALVNKHQDADWCILKVDLKGLNDITCYRDIWSRSGIIIRSANPIPSDRIECCS